MNIILELKNGGSFRRQLEDMLRRNGWWVHSVHPKTFLRAFEKIIPPPYDDGLDVEYEYVVAEFDNMMSKLREDKAGVCLIVVDISPHSMNKLKGDYGAFGFSDFENTAPKQVFEILTGIKED